MPGIKAVATGRAARRSPVTRRTRRLSGLRKNSFAISVMLLVQYGLGMGVNLYANWLPTREPGSSRHWPLISQPVVLAVHATLGVLMLVAGVSVLVRAIVARHRPAIASSAAGLAAIAAAAFSGATFSNGQDGASMAMAILTGVALLCYLANLLVVGPPTTPGREMIT